MIVTKDFKRKKIYASTLNDKDWLALRDRLLLFNVKVNSKGLDVFD
jgi:hypothetical protein